MLTCKCFAHAQIIEQLQSITNHRAIFMMATNSKHSVSTGSGSWFSVKSAKSAVEQIPKTRACPWVAQWFTIPQAILKPVQMVSCTIILFLYLD